MYLEMRHVFYFQVIFMDSIMPLFGEGTDGKCFGISFATKTQKILLIVTISDVCRRECN